MKTLLILIIGVGIGLGVYWYLNNPNADKKLEQAREQISNGVEETRSKINTTVSNVDTEQIREELARTGQIVRSKTEEAGKKIADATTDTRVTAAIKSKFAVDRELSALSISVNTTQGKVTLAGTVSSYELIDKAVRLALQTDGATEVISTLQVKK